VITGGVLVSAEGRFAFGSAFRLGGGPQTEKQPKNVGEKTTSILKENPSFKNSGKKVHGKRDEL